MYLEQRDYNTSIAPHELEIITADNVFAIGDAEETAVGVISSYLRSNYDLPKVFRPITEWNETITYKEGDRVTFSINDQDVLFYAKAENTGKTPGTDTEWQRGNNMDPVIKMRLLDVTLYLLHKKCSLVTLPDKIAIAYEEAITWLKAVNNGIIDAGLPAKPITIPSTEPGDQAGQSVLYTSRPRRKTHNII